MPREPLFASYKAARRAHWPELRPQHAAEGVRAGGLESEAAPGWKVDMVTGWQSEAAAAKHHFTRRVELEPRLSRVSAFSTSTEVSAALLPALISHPGTRRGVTRALPTCS